jgi:hypothetical protein
MAHDPITSQHADFPPFSQWLSVTLRHMSNPGNKKIGLKLDFKDFSAVEPCLKEIKKHHALISHKYPIWLNADILQGPHGRPSSIDASEFVQLCKDYGFVELDECTLSLGWTTGTNAGFSDYIVFRISER